MAVDPAHSVIFGGQLLDPIDFGGGPLPLFSNPEGPVNGFVAKLFANGDSGFAQRTGFSFVEGIAVNRSTVAVSNTERTQLHHEHLLLLDAGGDPVVRQFTLGLDDRGFGRKVAISESGRIWWNIETAFPNIPTWPYVIAIEP
jgi:hypothetical protein